jgi:hypothetical protein
MSKLAALRPAVPVALGFAVAACIIQEPPPRHPQPLPANEYGERAATDPGGGVLPDGDYACSIYNGYQYPPFRCVVYTAGDGTKMLDKVGGSQRIRGRATPTASGFYFEGQFYCPWGACDEATAGEFVAEGGQTFRGSLPSQYGGSTVTLTYLPGGFTYGGMAYGGASYGGHAPPPPRR